MVRRWLIALCLTCALGSAAGARPPARVLSMNLCTDQLAMMLAAPGQLVSVSHLARDPRSSAMADQAMAYPANHGLAEEIFLTDPDLILTGSYSNPATTALLQRLGKRVETFPPEQDFDDLRANIRRMGRVLGREVQAEAMIARFDADLAAIRPPSSVAPRAAMYDANGYSIGPDSLAGQIIEAAGFANIGAELDLGFGAVLPLEVLALSDPDLVITGHPYPGASRAEEVLDHPALQALTGRVPVRVISDGEWVCGTPHILRAVARLRDAGGQM